MRSRPMTRWLPSCSPASFGCPTIRRIAPAGSPTLMIGLSARQACTSACQKRRQLMSVCCLVSHGLMRSTCLRKRPGEARCSFGGFCAAGRWYCLMSAVGWAGGTIGTSGREPTSSCPCGQPATSQQHCGRHILQSPRWGTRHSLWRATAFSEGGLHPLTSPPNTLRGATNTRSSTAPSTSRSTTRLSRWPTRSLADSNGCHSHGQHSETIRGGGICGRGLTVLRSPRSSSRSTSRRSTSTSSRLDETRRQISRVCVRASSKGRTGCASHQQANCSARKSGSSSIYFITASLPRGSRICHGMLQPWIGSG